MTTMSQTKNTGTQDRVPGISDAMDSLVASVKEARQNQTIMPPVRSVTVKSVQVAVDTFIGYEDNPKQRDTERHAVVAKRFHLKDSSPAQARVAAATYNGHTFKVDGHTRALLWSRNELTRPNAVNVDLYECQSLTQLLDLYDTFDNKRAAENPADRLSGALRLAGMDVHSPYFKSYGFSSIFTVLSGRWFTGLDMVPYLNAYRNEIMMLDALHINKRIFKGGVVAGAILLLAKYGERILPFFDALNNNRGVKVDGECDGVQALYELITTNRTKGGWGDLNTLAKRTLSCGERWMAGEMYKTTRGGATVKDTNLGPYLKKVA